MSGSDSPLSSLVTQVSQNAVPTRPIRPKAKPKSSKKSSTKGKGKDDAPALSTADETVAVDAASTSSAASREARPTDPTPLTDDSSTQQSPTDASSPPQPVVPNVHKQASAQRLHSNHVGLGSASDAAIFQSKQAAAHDAFLSTEPSPGSTEVHKRNREPSPPRTGSTKGQEELEEETKADREQDWSHAGGRHPTPLRRKVTDPSPTPDADADDTSASASPAPPTATSKPRSKASSTSSSKPLPKAPPVKVPPRSGSLLRNILNKAFHSSQTDVSQKEREKERELTATTPVLTADGRRSSADSGAHVGTSSVVTDDASGNSPTVVGTTNSLDTKVALEPPAPETEKASATPTPTGGARLKSRRTKSIPPGARPAALDRARDPLPDSGGWLCGLGGARPIESSPKRHIWFSRSKKRSAADASNANINGHVNGRDKSTRRDKAAVIATGRTDSRKRTKSKPDPVPKDAHLAPPSTPRKTSTPGRPKSGKKGRHSRSGSTSPLRSRRLPGSGDGSPNPSNLGNPDDGDTSETGLTSSAVVTPGSGKAGVSLGRVEQESLAEAGEDLRNLTPSRRRQRQSSSSLSSSSSLDSHHRRSAILQDGHAGDEYTDAEGQAMEVDDEGNPVQGSSGSEGSDEDDDESTESARLIARGGMGITVGPDGQLKPLLPPLGKQDAGRKCLVLDLDETLVHSSIKPMSHDADFIIPIEIDSQMYNFYVLKRPGVDTFLREMGKVYEIVVFTASLAKYADRVLDRLDLDQVVRHRLFRESCFKYKDNYIKDLSQLGRPLEDTIIIDNSPTCYIFQPSNAVPIGSWFSDNHDTELLDLVPFLEDLAKVDDVRDVLDLGTAF